MRTTLNIEDRIYKIVKQLATQQEISVGELVSQLLKKAIGSRRSGYRADGFPLFHVSENAEVITLDDIKKDEDLE